MPPEAFPSSSSHINIKLEWIRQSFAVQPVYFPPQESFNASVLLFHFSKNLSGGTLIVRLGVFLL